MLVVRAVQPEDRQLDRAWSWLVDNAYEVEGLVAVAATGKLVGLAHYRAIPRPRFAGVDGFLDDLFVDPTRVTRGRRTPCSSPCRTSPRSADGAWSAGSPPTTTTGPKPSTTSTRCGRH